MSGNINFANLSYKELQALALRYRVPGNIKKHLLIEVLEAAKCGNEQEVDKLLTDLRQNRKKRVRKGKPTKLTMSLASTPIHSPSYDMAEDYYNAQHRLPYQWVGAEEEIPNRQLDEANRVPQYEEFRQFLLRRIQRDYQTYNINNNERVEPVDPGGTMDLRNDQGESTRFVANGATFGIRSSSVNPVNNLETVQSYAEQIAHNPSAAFDYQILEDPNGNGNGNNTSILLRRMLQAPVGADLGEIASPEFGPSGCRIWGNDQYQNENNLLDNSDTLSANSDINGNDAEDNWPVGTEYYRFVNNVREQLVLNSGNMSTVNRNNFDQPSTAVGQFCTVFTDDNPVHYQLLYANQTPDVQQQQWEAPTAFDQDALNYQKGRNLGSKIFSAGTNAYYDGIGAANYAGTRISDNDNHLPQQYMNDEGSGYSGNQHGFEGDRSEMKFYQNLNNNNQRGDHTAEVYSTLQNPPREINDPNDYTHLARNQVHQTNYYQSAGEPIQQTSGFVQHLPYPNSHQQQPPPAHNGYVDNLGCNSNPNIVQTATQPVQSIEEYNRPSIFEYQMIHRGNLLPEPGSQDPLYQNVERDAISKAEAEGEIDVENKTILESTSTTQSDSTLSLDPFWPRRSAPGVRSTQDNCLENILNLNTCGYIDYSKIDQTSCIYCYSAPIVTQKLFTGSFPCSQKKRFIAEFRQHTFAPSWLLYNDANTGMQMSNVKCNVNNRDIVEEPAVVEKWNERIIASNLDSVNFEDNHKTPDRDINDSEFRIDEQQINSGITEPVKVTRQSYGEKISTIDSNVQQNVRSEDCSNPVSEIQGETNSSVNLNMEDVNC